MFANPFGESSFQFQPARWRRFGMLNENNRKFWARSSGPEHCFGWLILEILNSTHSYFKLEFSSQSSDADLLLLDICLVEHTFQMNNVRRA